MGGSFEEQLVAFQSLQRHVITPLLRNMWNVVVGVDTIVLEKRLVELREAMISSFSGVLGVYFRPNKGKNGLQTDGWHSTIQWAKQLMNSTCPGSMGLFIARADIKWTTDLPLPTPTDSPGLVLASWPKGELPSGRDHVADCFFFIAHDQIRNFEETLLALSRESKRDLHDVQDFWPDYNNRPIGYVCPELVLDSNPSFMWNPFYSLIGRRISSWSPLNGKDLNSAIAACGIYQNQGMKQNNTFSQQVSVAVPE
mmetsp:Transcript_32452/g.39944  ORF Transcript_32452/g.39944 Transcript_32452/m.39944 type:complete len:254 (+) Transcript_32452:197-958(+)